jgi:RhtB (resistance to homoserine/threonine) family protein
MPHDLLPFTIAAALLTLSPGPDTMLVLRNTLRGGRSDGVRTTLGICSGLLVHATLSALGLSVILVRSAGLFTAVKLVGAAYLVWLGLQSLQAAARGGERETGNGKRAGAEGAARRRPYREGLLTNVLNPKVAVFYLAFLPQFIAPGDPVLATSLLLASIHNAMGLVWLNGLAAGADRAQRVIAGAGVRRVLDGVCGAVLVGLGARLAVTKR